MTATIVPASSALTMNGYVNSCRKSSSRFHDKPWKTAASSMAVAVMAGRLGLADDDEPPVRGVQHLDRHAEEPRQRLARDHISRPAADRAAAGDIDDLVDEAEDRVDVVRDEQDGDVLLLADPAHERGDRGLAREVEAVERLVQQEQLRAADERLRLSTGGRQQAEDRLHQRRLAGPVRAEHGHELAPRHPERDVLEDRAPAESDGRPLQGDSGLAHLPVASASARRSASSWADCQSWNRAEAGVIVSVIVVTGMPCLRAASVIRCTSGVLFWLLKTQTLICCF